jgi:hypothetical protein
MEIFIVVEISPGNEKHLLFHWNSISTKPYKYFSFDLDQMGQLKSSQLSVNGSFLSVQFF